MTHSTSPTCLPIRVAPRYQGQDVFLSRGWRMKEGVWVLVRPQGRTQLLGSSTSQPGADQLLLCWWLMLYRDSSCSK